MTYTKEQILRAIEPVLHWYTESLDTSELDVLDTLGLIVKDLEDDRKELLVLHRVIKRLASENQPSRQELKEAIVAMADSIELVHKTLYVIQPFLKIYLKHGKCINWATEEVPEKTPVTS